MSDRVFYINGQWLTYSQAHSLGYTTQKPESVKFYTSDLTEVYLRKDVSDNTYYNSSTSEWLDDITDFGVYAFVGSSVMYRINDPIEYTCYSNTVKSDSFTHVIVDEALVPIDYLIDDEGLTTYPCQPYLMVDGVVTSWYDPEKELYWDNTDGKKKWSENPPVIAQGDLQDVFIMPSTCEAYLLPQWEDDLSQMMMRYRTSAFDEQDLQIDSQKPMLTGFPIAFDYDAPIMFAAYTDITELNKTFYVYPDKGVADYTGKHHEQGDTFIGDYTYVWVDSDHDVVFYKGQQQYIFGQSHDEKYLELYWCEDKYRTYQEVLNLGYSLTPSEVGLYASDTNIEFEIDVTYKVMENKSLGYYCNGEWYQTEYDLNNAGYYLVDKVTQVVYLGRSGNYVYFEPNITCNSVSFDTTNAKYISSVLDKDDMTTPVLWDGHNWFMDLDETSKLEYNGYTLDPVNFVENLYEMPSFTVSSNHIRAIIPITASGNPVNKFNPGELNTPLKVYACTNNVSQVSGSRAYYRIIALSYWQLI